MNSVTNNRAKLQVIQGGPVATLTDADLVLAAQAGDHKAFDQLMRRNSKLIQGTLFKLAPDWRQQHEDMTQDAMLRVWRSIGSLKNPAAFKSWVVRVVTNQFYDQLRQKPRFFMVSLDAPISEDEETPTRDIADERAQPDEVLERKQIIEDVQNAIRELPAQFQNVLVLREFHGLPYDEIAAITNSEIGTVKSRIARARVKVQGQIAHLRTAS